MKKVVLSLLHTQQGPAVCKNLAQSSNKKPRQAARISVPHSHRSYFYCCSSSCTLLCNVPAMDAGMGDNSNSEITLPQAEKMSVYLQGAGFPLSAV